MTEAPLGARANGLVVPTHEGLQPASQPANGLPAEPAAAAHGPTVLPNPNALAAAPDNNTLATEASSTRPAVSPALPLLVMGLVVISWGMGPPVTKLLTAHPLVSALYRFAMASPFLLLVLVLRGKRLRWSVFRRTALPGLSFGINMVFVFAAVQQVTISVLSTMMALQPALLLLFVGPIFGDKVHLRQLLFTLVGVVGAVAVVAGAGGELRAPPVGLLLGALSVLTFSVYFVLTRVAQTVGPVDPIEWMAGINIWSLTAVVAPAFALLKPTHFAEFGGADWLWIVVVAFGTGVFGHVLMTWCHGHIEVARSSLYVLAMHIVAVGMAWVIHGEPLTGVQLLGGAVVLGSVAMVIRTPSDPATDSQAKTPPAPSKLGHTHEQRAAVDVATG